MDSGEYARADFVCARNRKSHSYGLAFSRGLTNLKLIDFTPPERRGWRGESGDRKHAVLVWADILFGVMTGAFIWCRALLLFLRAFGSSFSWWLRLSVFGTCSLDLHDTFPAWVRHSKNLPATMQIHALHCTLIGLMPFMILHKQIPSMISTPRDDTSVLGPDWMAGIYTWVPASVSARRRIGRSTSHPATFRGQRAFIWTSLPVDLIFLGLESWGLLLPSVSLSSRAVWRMVETVLFPLILTLSPAWSFLSASRPLSSWQFYGK